MPATRTKVLMENNSNINDDMASENSHLVPNRLSAYAAFNEKAINSYQNDIQHHPPTYQDLNHESNTKLCPTCKGKGRIGQNKVSLLLVYLEIFCNSRRD
jgi:hypothetical protein